MTKKHQPHDSYIQDLRAQAAATREAAKLTNDTGARTLAIKAAETLEAMARGQARKNEPGHVLALPDTASVSEVREHRRQRSLRYGEDVYLPTWHDAAVVLPNRLLRSSLFSAGEPGAPLDGHILGTQGGFSIEMTGPQLCYYDRRLFGVCLKHYQAERPLASNTSQWVRTTFWQLSKAMFVAYNGNVHKAIRSSLKRLHAATLRIKVGRFDLPMPRLIEVAFDDGFTDMNTPDHELKASDRIAFRVQDSMATLFGPNEWTAVSDHTLHDYRGLAAWLCSYYATHRESFELKVRDLYSYSGSKGGLAEFRKRLKDALKQLQSDDAAEEHRVARYEMSKETITVHLARWERPRSS